MYNHKAIEQKWKESWEKQDLFQKTYEKRDLGKKKNYLLFAFSYPSGEGLHVGHVESKTALDILGRYKRMKGEDVFFPVGWDAFGLPAENYAIKTGTPPEETTKKAIETFKRQIKDVGISYDWETEIATCHPEYYKWTQWLFLKLFEKGLAYKKKSPVNWCPSCQTVLANEQVVSGECERCGTQVIQKDLEQWFFKITDYKDELISGLEQVDWPEYTKQKQINWIGKKTGINITYNIDQTNESITCFTTRPDTNFGATFVVLAPEHDFIKKIVNGEVESEFKLDIETYVKKANSKTELERQQEGTKKTGVFTGYYAINHLTGKKMPVWVSDFVLGGFGTGAVVGVPGHDKRDFEFAKTFDIEIIRVVVGPDKDESEITDISKVQEESGYMINSGFLDGMDIHEATVKVMDHIEEKGWGEKIINYRLRDWSVGRQRYWGAPIPIVYDPEGKAHPVKEEHLPWILPTDVDFNPTNGESPLKSSKEFKERVEKLYGEGWTPEYDTLDTFVDSSWYFLRFTDPRNTEEFASKKQIEKWMPVDFYMIGPEHTVLHLLYSRFLTKFLRDEGYLSFDEPFIGMRHQGMILGPDNKKMSKSKGNVISPDAVVEEYGADTLRVYEMFMGPIDADKPWNENGVKGIKRFLDRVFIAVTESESNPDKSSESLERDLHKLIKKVGSDIENLKYNTAISAFMEFLNMWEKEPEQLGKEDVKTFIKLLAPFAPFIAEDLWSIVNGGEGFVHNQLWPEYDSELSKDRQIKVIVQVNGKLKGSILVDSNELNDEYRVKNIAKDSISNQLKDKVIIKEIYVSGKIVNFVVR